MDINKLISVIVPVYNVEEYLEECLDSIQKQTYSNIEVILVNDGSTDNSKEICERYCRQDNRFKWESEYLWENIYFLWIVMMLLRLIF